MQQPIAAPRETLTVAQVVRLIQDVPAAVFGCGCDVIDMNLNVLAELGGDFKGGSVTRSAYADLHGTGRFEFATELDWGAAIVRPWASLSAEDVTARFHLGAYFVSIPARQLEEDPPTYEVQGYDILSALNDRVGESYAVDAGVTYLTAAETILLERGYLQYVIDQESAAAVLPSARVWPIDDNRTWLHIVNDLLGAVGYQGVWSDWDGRLRLQPYQAPLDRAPEWYYDTGPDTSMLSPARLQRDDFYDAPNRWIAVRSNNVDGPAPVEGNGIFTYVNDSDGPTSVAARGRTITADIMQLDVADQASLERAAMSRIDADIRRKSTIELATWPNPLHWHFDRLLVNDPGLGANLEILSTGWTLPLDGGDQTHLWSVL